MVNINHQPRTYLKQLNGHKKIKKKKDHMATLFFDRYKIKFDLAFYRHWYVSTFTYIYIYIYIYKVML